MKKNQFHFTFVLFLIVSVFVGCTNVQLSDYYEVDGLVAGAFIDSSKAPGWESIQYINSRGLIYKPDESINAEPLSFTVYFSTPGNYSFWILTTSGESADSLSTLNLSVTGPDSFLITQATAELPEDQQLFWIKATSDDSTNIISIDKPGQYTFLISPRNSEHVQVHKIQMSRNDIDKPFGLGLPSSKRTDLSAADLFREIPVMLPPSWVFKPVIGATDEGNISSDILRDSITTYDLAGGMWLDTTPDGQLTDSSALLPETDLAPGVQMSVKKNCTNSVPVFEFGYRFIVTNASPEIECLERIHQDYQETHGPDQRSVLFHGIKNAYNPDSKQYPAPMTSVYKFEWTAESLVQEGEFIPGGYRELVSDLVNPENSLYGMPFLSMPVDYQSRAGTPSGWDSELFIRTVQLSPFLPVMHLILPYNVVDEGSLSEQLISLEKQQLLDAFALRSTLFPYHYTYAHYTRQTNESIISGFRQYPMQFMYGDAFLVAPVTEPNTDGRVVYFPEGRRWYNYYSGEAFEAGRSWFVETSLDRLPLFVKAGSIVPYQMDENSDSLKIEIYTGDAGAFRLVEDDGETRAYRRAEAARTMFRYNEVEGNLTLTIGAVQANFEGMADRRSYIIHFKFVDIPERVEINGSEVPRSSGEDRNMNWRYNESDSEIVLSLNDVSKHEKLDIIIHP